MRKDEEAIVVQQDFSQPTSTVWDAITDVTQMREWFFDNIPDFKAEPGFRTQFTVDAGDRKFLHYWEVIEVVPQRKIVYSWSYAGYAGNSTSSFEVFGDEKSSSLTLTMRVLEDFQEDIPEFERESGVGGWNYFIKERLKTYLDGESPALKATI